MSRYDIEKQPRLLVEAFFHLEIGKLSFEDDLERKTAKKFRVLSRKNLEKQFVLCSATNNIEEKLCLASSYVIPSEFEEFYLSLVEAMATVLPPPIGITDCPAVNSLIHNNNNGLLSKSSAQHLASSLEQLMLNQFTKKTWTTGPN